MNPFATRKELQVMKPGPRSLFEAINGLVKLANMIRETRILELGWLPHIHRIGQVAMKKGIVDIKLVELPVINNNNSQDNPDCCRLHHRAKSMRNVETGNLTKTLSNKACFMSINRAIG